jgi:CHAT domain-containing protein
MITGNIPFLHPVVGLQVQDVADWKTTNLKTEIMKSRIGECALQDLQPLITPLLVFSKPDDLLVLCPTGPLHGLPLHAIEIEPDTVLIERNPVIYTTSIAVLRHCLNGLTLHRGPRMVQSEATDGHPPESGTHVSFLAEKSWKVAIMSFYGLDNQNNSPAEVKQVHDHIHKLSQWFNTKPTLGNYLTAAAFSDQVLGANLIHFHGHASFDANDIHSQSLVLADGHLGDAESHEKNMSVSKIFGLKLSAPHVSNIACDSGRQDIGHGDETLGITSAFLYAGASSVVGTLWPTSSASGRAFSEKFYQSFRVSAAGPIDLAVALQQAVLAIRDTTGTDELYYWAGFVLHGMWFCPHPLLPTAM